MKNEIFQRRKRILLIVLFAVSIALAPQAARADDNSSTVKKSVELQSGGWLVREKVDLHSLNFDEDKWVYCIIKVKGHWQKDITHKPSQKFNIQVNGKKIFDGELYGDKTLTMNLGETTQTVNVTGYMQCCNAATNAKGSIEVICFREKPGIFYVTEVTYDVKNARLLDSPELPVGRETIEENKTDEESGGTYKVTYTETNSLTWEKSFEHAESIGISIGYKAGDGGGFEAMGSLAANFKTAYKTGSTEQKSESIERSTSYKVPPHTTKRIFVVQTKNIYEMPYTMKGYTLDENGKRRCPFEKKDKCIFVGVQSTRILQEPVGKEGQLMAGAGPEVIAEWTSELK